MRVFSKGVFLVGSRSYTGLSEASEIPTTFSRKDEIQWIPEDEIGILYSGSMLNL